MKPLVQLQAIKKGKEERERVRRAVESLDEKHRTIVVLYYFNDFTTPEIARITGCLEGTVKSRLHTARKRLERYLAKEEAVGVHLERAVGHRGMVDIEEEEVVLEAQGIGTRGLYPLT